MLIAPDVQGRRAMQMLCGRHLVRVFGLGLLVHDQQAAEDLICGVFLDVGREAGKSAGRSAASTWFLAIAWFMTVSALRRGKDAEPEDGADNAMIRMPRCGRSVPVKASWICVAALSPEHREVVYPVYYYDKSVDDVARIVGTPKDAAKARLFF